MFNRTPKLVLDKAEQRKLQFIVTSLGLHPDTILKHILDKGLSEWMNKIPRPDPPPSLPSAAIKYNSSIPIPPGKKVMHG